MSEKMMILAVPVSLTPSIPIAVGRATLASRIFGAINEKYDALIDILFKWTN